MKDLMEYMEAWELANQTVLMQRGGDADFPFKTATAAVQSCVAAKLGDLTKSL